MAAAGRGRKWTTEELQQLRHLIRTAPVREVARVLGRSVDAVRTKAAQERIPIVQRTAKRGPARAPMPWDQESEP